MKIFLKILAFMVLFVAFFVWQFPYDTLVERGVRQAESATGAVIIYQPVSAGPLGVKVKDLSVRLVSGAFLQFDSARLFPTTNGVNVTAYQGENEMRAEIGGSQLKVKLNDINVATGNEMFGTTRATGDLTYGLMSREGQGSLRLVVPELGMLPIPLGAVELGSTFVIKNVGTKEAPRTGVSAELKLLSGDGSASANGTVTLEGQPPPGVPLLSGNLRFESPIKRGNIILSGTWDNPTTTITSK